MATPTKKTIAKKVVVKATSKAGPTHSKPAKPKRKPANVKATTAQPSSSAEWEARLREVVEALPGGQLDQKWGIDNVAVVHKKMFAVFAPSVHTDRNSSWRLGVKVDDDRFLEWTDRPGIIPAPYLARVGWVQLVNLNDHDVEDVTAMIHRAYEIIVAKLPKKVQLSLKME